MEIAQIANLAKKQKKKTMHTEKSKAKIENLELTGAWDYPFKNGMVEGPFYGKPLSRLSIIIFLMHVLPGYLLACVQMDSKHCYMVVRHIVYSSHYILSYRSHYYNGYLF